MGAASKSRWAHVRNSETWGVRSAFFGTVLTIGAVVVGLFGSILNPEIRSAFPFVGWFEIVTGKWSWGTPAPVAIIFWISVGLLAFGLFSRQLAIDRDRTVAENRLNKRTREALDFLRGQVPGQIFDAFFTLLEESQKSYMAIQAAAPADRTRDAVIEALLTILSSVLELARGFDSHQSFEGRQSARYAINVMQSKPIEDINDDAWEELESEDKLKFVDPEVRKGGLPSIRAAVSAILVLRQELSTSTDTPTNQPDSKLRPLALPIPSELSAPNGKSAVLPGAPQALTSGEPAPYPDTREMANQCRDEGDFKGSVIGQIDSYFRRESDVRSLLSLPVHRIAPGSAPIGVINIHVDQTNLLADKKTRDQFLRFVQPFVYWVGELLPQSE